MFGSKTMYDMAGDKHGDLFSFQLMNLVSQTEVSVPARFDDVISKSGALRLKDIHVKEHRVGAYYPWMDGIKKLAPSRYYWVLEYSDHIYQLAPKEDALMTIAAEALFQKKYHKDDQLAGLIVGDDDEKVLVQFVPGARPAIFSKILHPELREYRCTPGQYVWSRIRDVQINSENQKIFSFSMHLFTLFKKNGEYLTTPIGKCVDDTLPSDLPKPKTDAKSLIRPSGKKQGFFRTHTPSKPSEQPQHKVVHKEKTTDIRSAEKGEETVSSKVSGSSIQLEPTSLEEYLKQNNILRDKTDLVINKADVAPKSDDFSRQQPSDNSAAKDVKEAAVDNAKTTKRLDHVDAAVSRQNVQEQQIENPYSSHAKADSSTGRYDSAKTGVTETSTDRKSVSDLMIDAKTGSESESVTDAKVSDAQTIQQNLTEVVPGITVQTISVPDHTGQVNTTPIAAPAATEDKKNTIRIPKTAIFVCITPTDETVKQSADDVAHGKKGSAYTFENLIQTQLTVKTDWADGPVKFEKEKWYWAVQFEDRKCYFLPDGKIDAESAHQAFFDNYSVKNAVPCMITGETKDTLIVNFTPSETVTVDKRKYQDLSNTRYKVGRAAIFNVVQIEGGLVLDLPYYVARAGAEDNEEKHNRKNAARERNTSDKRTKSSETTSMTSSSGGNSSENGNLFDKESLSRSASGNKGNNTGSSSEKSSSDDDITITTRSASLLLRRIEDKSVIDALEKKLNKKITADVLISYIKQRRVEELKDHSLSIHYKGLDETDDVDLLIRNQNGVPIKASIVGTRKDRNSRPEKYSLKKLAATPIGTEFDRFVYVEDWNQLTKDLKEISLKEDWGGDTSKNGRLAQYLIATFYKAWLDNEIVEDISGDHAVINTGLVDPSYDDVYFCMEKNDHGKKWRYLWFACKGKDYAGKKLVDWFIKLPDPPKYIDLNHMEDIYFDTSKELSVDYNHILMDNIARLPKSFIIARLSSFDPYIREKMTNDQTEYFVEGNRTDEEVIKHIQNNDGCIRALTDGLKGAVSTAIKFCRWNYKTAVPIYYAKTNRISLLIPLKLNYSDKPADVALVIEKLSSGNYQGQTILTLDMAYKDARQICRPNNDWLSEN